MTHLPIPLIHPGSPPRFPLATQALREPNGLLAIGGDLTPRRLMAAYRQGIFPWYGDDEPILWWTPDPRCVFRSDGLHVTRRLARQLRQSAWTLTLDQAFREVVLECAAPRAGQRGGTWIVTEMIDAYCNLHSLGYAHSVEVWAGDTLVGGLYGVAMGRMFCGESMFSAASGGSKAALVGLCRLLQAWDFPLLDAQVGNPHLYSMGAIDLPRREFLAQLAQLAASPAPADAFHLPAPLHVASLAQM